MSYVVEVKHWRSKKKVGPAVVRDLFQVTAHESHDAGLVLATYGFSSSAIQVLSEIERTRIYLGSEAKIVSLCKTYMATTVGLQIPDELLPQAFLKDTQ